MIYIVLITLTILEMLIIAMYQIAILFIIYFIMEKSSTYYQNWKNKKQWQEGERRREEFIQEQHRRELHKREIERYPLFYLKEGIV